MAGRGHSVCLIDLDPQAHLTLHFGAELGKDQSSIYDVLSSGASLQDATLSLGENLSLVPSVIDLAAAEVELVTTVGREQILRDALAGAESAAHELAMIDCPPSLGLLTLNALAAADDVIIPLQPHFLALQGLGKLLETVSLVQKRINPKLRVLGVILCMYETTTRLAAEVVGDLEQFFASHHGLDVPWAKACIFRTRIRRNIKLAECPSYGRTIFDYEPNSHGAQDYAGLAVELLQSLGMAEAPTATETVVETAMEASRPTEVDASAPTESPADGEDVPADASTVEPETEETRQVETLAAVDVDPKILHTPAPPSCHAAESDDTVACETTNASEPPPA